MSSPVRCCKREISVFHRQSWDRDTCPHIMFVPRHKGILLLAPRSSRSEFPLLCQAEHWGHNLLKRDQSFSELVL